MKQLLYTFAVVMLLSHAGGAIGQTYYSGEAVVSGQSESERRSAVPNALENAVSRLSGLRDFSAYEGLQEQFRQGRNWVLSYHYRDVEQLLGDGTTTVEQRLVVRFSPGPVDQLMLDHGLPRWQIDRPSPLVWIVVDDGSGRRVMPVELAYIRQSMDLEAATRGLGLTWPQPGSDGFYQVDRQLLWGGYTEDLATTEQPDVLIAAARREGAEWNVRWNLGYGGRHGTWRTRDLDLGRALVDGLQVSIDEIAAANSIAAKDQGSWTYKLLVTGLRGAGDYERCLGYLSGVSVVEEVGLVSAAPGRVEFLVHLNASPEYLKEELRRDQLLTHDPDLDSYTLMP